MPRPSRPPPGHGVEPAQGAPAARPADGGRVGFQVEFAAGRTVTGDDLHVLRPAGMDAWIIHLTDSGQGLIHCGDRQIHAGPGRMLLWPPGVPHHYGARGGRAWIHWWIYVQPRAHWLDWLGWRDAGGGVLTLDLASHALLPRIRRCFADAVEVMQSTQPRRVALGLAITEQLLLWCDAANPDATARVDARLAAALDRAAAHLHRRITVAELAGWAGVSPSRFAHLCTGQLGMPPLRWLERRRIDEARQLLALTTRPVAAIGADCGFADPTWFARVFRRHAGMSPVAWRRRAALG